MGAGGGIVRDLVSPMWTASLGRELSEIRRGSQDVVHGRDSPCPVFIRS